MLKKEAQEKLLKALKYDDAKITEVLADGEFDIDVPADVKIYAATEYTELETNLRKGYIKDKDAAEIWCRTMNTEHELGLTGAAAKDQKKVLEAMKAKWVKESGATPADWQAKFDTLQTTVDTEKATNLTYKQQVEALQAEKKYRKLFWADMSDALDSDEWVARLQKTFDIKEENGIEGLWDKSKGKYIMDDKANVLPFAEAWEALRKDDRFKSWHKAKEAAPTPEPRKTHDPNNRNPALPRAKKYSTSEEIMKEVDKKYPPEKKGQMAGWAKNRGNYFKELQAQSA